MCRIVSGRKRQWLFDLTGSEMRENRVFRLRRKETLRFRRLTNVVTRVSSKSPRHKSRARTTHVLRRILSEEQTITKRDSPN